MHFAPDTELTLEFTVALADTMPTASRSGADELTTVAQLDALVDQWQWSGRRDHDERELREVREIRDLLPALWTLPTDQAVPIINRMLADAHALPHLYRHDDFDWHLHATEQDAPFAERMRVEIALALVDVIRSGETKRLRVCEADDCEGLFVDLSRNGSKRFCSVRCGNRMNMIAFRERQSAEEAPLSTTPRVRAARPDDEPGVKACVVAAFEGYIARIGKPPAPMLLDFRAQIAANHVWVVQDAEQIVGVLIQYETDRGFYIDAVAVAPSSQGTGVGRALLQFAEEEAQRRGYDSIYLYTNSKMTENQALYPRIGYLEYERKHEGGYDRIFYVKRLS